GADLAAAAGLAEDRDVAGIAAEALGIVAHPLQRGAHVERAGVAGLGKVLAAEVGKIHVTKNVEALIDGHHHNVVVLGEAGAIKPRHIGGANNKDTAAAP